MGNDILDADDELLTSDQVKRMNHPFDVEGIKKGMRKLLEKPACAAFVKRLLEMAAQAAPPGDKPLWDDDVVNDVLKIFETVLAQKGLVRAGDTAKGAIGGASFASGSIRNKDARIQIGVLIPGGSIRRSQAVRDYLTNDIIYCLHESLHHASEMGYTDEVFARAVSIMNGGNPALPDTTDRFEFSRYWDDELRKTII